MSKVTGKVSQIVGPVIDVEFDSGADLPKIYDSLEINRPDGSTSFSKFNHTLVKILSVLLLWIHQMD